MVDIKNTCIITDEVCKKCFFSYQDKCFLLSGWMYTCFTLCMLGTFLCFFVVCVFNHLFKKSSTKDHPQIIKHVGSRSVHQYVGPDLDQFFLQKLKVIGKAYFDTLIA